MDCNAPTVNLRAYTYAARVVQAPQIDRREDDLCSSAPAYKGDRSH
jgi:hypothetical protein